MRNQPTHLEIIGRSATGLPRTYRRAPAHQPATAAAYRRLAVAIFGLDVATLARELRSSSQRFGLPSARAA
jgi:hypothetical protein